MLTCSRRSVELLKMAETLVENQICDACGADVRKGALFCYHCGSQVASDINAEDEEKTLISQVQIQKNTSRESKNGNNLKRKAAGVRQQNKEITDEKATSMPIEDFGQEIKLKAAARQKSKPLQPKKIEVIWEERENAPNVWFVAAALVLTVLVVVILFLALRMK